MKKIKILLLSLAIYLYSVVPAFVVQAIVPLDNPEQPAIMNYYGALIKNAHLSDDSYESEYSLYDFDKDGILELIIDSNEPHAMRTIRFYKFDRGLTSMGTYQPGYAELCRNPNGTGIVLYYALRNRQRLDLLTYDIGVFQQNDYVPATEVYWPDEYDDPEDILKGAKRLEKCSTGSNKLLKKYFDTNISKKLPSKIKMKSYGKRKFIRINDTKAKYRVNNSNVAKLIKNKAVDKRGFYIKPLNSGKATITVLSSDGRKYKCKLIVKGQKGSV